METIYLRDYLKNLPRYLANKNQTVLGYTDATCVLQGADELNMEYCRQHNIEVYKTHNFGGNIVNFVGDLCIANYQTTFNTFGTDTLIKIKDMLMSKGLKAGFFGNDILIDETYKVASYTSTYINGCLYTAIHISMNVDLDVIKAICIKPMVKIPKGLSDYNLTTNDILDAIK